MDSVTLLVVGFFMVLISWIVLSFMMGYYHQNSANFSSGAGMIALIFGLIYIIGIIILLVAAYKLLRLWSNASHVVLHDSTAANITAGHNSNLFVSY